MDICEVGDVTIDLWITHWAEGGCSKAGRSWDQSQGEPGPGWVSVVV